MNFKYCNMHLNHRNDIQISLKTGKKQCFISVLLESDFEYWDKYEINRRHYTLCGPNHMPHKRNCEITYVPTLMEPFPVN